MMAAAVVTAATCAQDEKVQQQITASRSIGEDFSYVLIVLYIKFIIGITLKNCFVDVIV